jgi:hypothetical protein
MTVHKTFYETIKFGLITLGIQWIGLCNLNVLSILFLYFLRAHNPVSLRLGPLSAVCWNCGLGCSGLCEEELPFS